MNMYPVQSRSSHRETRTLEGQHAHNRALTVGAEQGIVGLVALGVFVAAVVVAFSSARRFAPVVTVPTHTGSAGAAVTTNAAAAALVVLVGAGVVDYPSRNAPDPHHRPMFLGLVPAGHRCVRNRQDDQQVRSMPVTGSLTGIGGGTPISNYAAITSSTGLGEVSARNTPKPSRCALDGSKSRSR